MSTPFEIAAQNRARNAHIRSVIEGVLHLIEVAGHLEEQYLENADMLRRNALGEDTMIDRDDLLEAINVNVSANQAVDSTIVDMASQLEKHHGISA